MPHQKHLHKSNLLVYTGIFFCIHCSVFIDPLFAQNTNKSTPQSVSQKTLEDTDITKVGMNMFTNAYKWETGNYTGYKKDAFRGFSKKLNNSLKSDTNFSELYQACNKCSNIVEDSFDEALTEYLRETPPELTNGERGFFSILVPHLHPKIRAYPISIGTQGALNNIISSKVASITSQVTEQMDTYRDVSGMGLYYDGDLDNSPYDLLEDIRRIDAIFFREAPGFGDYKNTSKSDASGLITGQAQQGSWMGGGKNYEIDLLSDVKEAMGDSGDDNGSGSSNQNEVAGDCSSGYCVTVDFIQSTHYFLSGTAQSPGSGGSFSGGSIGGGENSFQGIFEEVLEWITKHGDKRNFACKTATTIFAYETENDMNLSLSKIFSGLGIHTFWKTPPFLLGFLDRNSRDGSSSNAASDSKKQTKDDQKTDDAIRTAFRAQGLDYDRPTDLLGTAEKAFAYSGFKNATVGDQPAQNVAESVSRSKDVYQQILKENGAGSNRVLTHENNRDSIKHIEKTFDEIVTRVRLLRQFSNDLNGILKSLKDKPDCGN